MECGNLVVTRRKGQVIEIGRDIVLTIIDIRPENVRVSIQAPKDVAVHRGEIAELIRKERGE